MADTVADFIWKRLHHWGARRVYGYPGDGIGGLVGALHRMQKEARDDADAPCIDFVQVRHEEMAGLCASAHAKFTGEVGLCMATSGPGAIHLLNGLYDAKGDHMPVVALVGQQARTADDDRQAGGLAHARHGGADIGRRADPRGDARGAPRRRRRRPARRWRAARRAVPAAASRRGPPPR